VSEATETVEITPTVATVSAIAEPRARNTRKLVGRVVSDKRSKTVTVLVERRVTHELYGKIVARSRKYHAHDENGEFKMGDMVEIAEGRPISKTKSWVVTRLIEKARLV
jgi:small subunit ribosomal protein S17